MYILGLNAFHADYSVNIFKDVAMITATEKKRSTWEWHQGCNTLQAINFCQRKAGISFKELWYIFNGRDLKVRFANKEHIHLVGNLFSANFVEQYVKPNEKGEELIQYYKELASTEPRLAEDVIFHLLMEQRKRTM